MAIFFLLFFLRLLYFFWFIIGTNPSLSFHYVIKKNWFANLEWLIGDWNRTQFEPESGVPEATRRREGGRWIHQRRDAARTAASPGRRSERRWRSWCRRTSSHDSLRIHVIFSTLRLSVTSPDIPINTIRSFDWFTAILMRSILKTSPFRVVLKDDWRHNWRDDMQLIAAIIQIPHTHTHSFCIVSLYSPPLPHFITFVAVEWMSAQFNSKRHHPTCSLSYKE